MWQSMVYDENVLTDTSTDDFWEFMEVVRRALLMMVRWIDAGLERRKHEAKLGQSARAAHRAIAGRG